MRYLAIAAAAAVLVLSLTGCDGRKCLQSHTEFMPVWMLDGKGGGSVSIVPMDICDKYEEPKH